MRTRTEAIPVSPRGAQSRTSVNRGDREETITWLSHKGGGGGGKRKSEINKSCKAREKD